MKEEKNRLSTKLVNTHREKNVFSSSILLDESTPENIVRYTIWIVAATLLIFIVWASFAQLDVVSTAKGVVMPVDSVKVIQHVDGGRIASIDVLDGMLVHKGQVLMRLNATEASAEFKTLESRYWALWASVQRVRALIDGGVLELGDIPKHFLTLVAEQKQTLQMSRLQREALEEDIRIFKELSAIRSDLEKDKLVSRVQVLDAKKNLNIAEAELLRFDRKSLDDLNTQASELAQVEGQMAKLIDRLERVEILAPDDGIVQDLKFRTVGGVVPPGAVVMNIVPSDGKIQAEVQLPANDIGFVKLDQFVRLKFGTFDFMRYGTVDGKVVMVSPFSTMDDKHLPHFKVLVSFTKKYLGLTPGQMKIEPGMTLDADIITDRQSVMRYLLRPIFYALSSGMRER